MMWKDITIKEFRKIKEVVEVLEEKERKSKYNVADIKVVERIKKILSTVPEKLPITVTGLSKEEFRTLIIYVDIHNSFRDGNWDYEAERIFKKLGLKFIRMYRKEEESVYPDITNKIATGSGLNLGCGTNIIEDYINVDKYKTKGVDRVHDLEEFPYPFKDNSTNKILINNVIEHLNVPLDKLFSEFKRILKDGGELTIIVPHYTYGNTFQEFHKRYFGINSFRTELLTQSGVRKDTSLERQNTYKGFKVIKTKIFFEKGIFFWNYITERIINSHWYFMYLWENTILKWIFPAQCIKFELKMGRRKG